MKKMLGAMIDCSRNAVMKVETVKRFVDIIKKMGYNTLMIYTEDTYEIDGEPYFGHFRGRYTKDELKEIDRYCTDNEIELIPCIQTLAHVSEMLRWKTVYGDIHDCRDVMIAEHEKTYKLVEAMISTCAECFTSKKIHIGMDEAVGLGTGNYKKLYGEKDGYEIMRSHLDRVCSITDKYGLEPMIWADMLLKFAINVEDQFKFDDASAISKKAKINDNISLIYWDYYSEDYDHYAKSIQAYKLFERKLYFAGGVWTWRGIAPDNTYAITITEQSMKACHDNGVEDVFFCLWGDDGAECSKFAVLPALMYAAEASRGNFDLESIKKKFNEVTGYDFDTMMLFDKLDRPGGLHFENPSKYLLYNDPFLGSRDYRCSDSDSGYFKNLAIEIENSTCKKDLKYLFDYYGKLADVLSYKCDLGKRLRKAYQSGDKAELTNIYDDLLTLTPKLEELYLLNRELWYYENKPHGFEVQDIKLGGVQRRIKNCTDRIKDYLDGKIDVIPELTEPELTEPNDVEFFWRKLVTPNIIL